MAKILIIDDEPGMRRILEVNLRRDGHVVVEADGVVEAMDLLKKEDFDVVLTDQKMPDGTGLDVLHAVQEDDPTTAVVFLTAVGTLELAVESMRQGAFDFLTKPFSPDVVRAAVRRASEHTVLLRENAALKTAVQKLEGTDEILGKSAAIGRVREFIGRVAGTSTTVLITGETGTGKELVARAIHRNSVRAKKPFIAINCAAVTETLLESELFGHERGAFTGADKSRSGLFEAAHEGTLFLDEVAEMSSAAQSKLLRVLADGEIQRVGSTVTRRVDVRVLAATHRNLEQRVREGQFREDLYYRLAVVPVHLAPLRDRPEDISELSQVLCLRIAAEMKVPARPISTAALAKLTVYSFPGNVRELKNLLERALILGQGSELQAEDFFLPARPATVSRAAEEYTVETLAAQLPEQLDLRQTLTGIERALIVRSLDLARGVQAEAARYLGISRSDLGYKVGKFGLLGAPGDKAAASAI
ncbi:Type 4 fimbriae expression regulatory protein PilR [Candidatus Sulfotelmatomonas gaucii]|uniref:Type 4 fimbriae expression regulatory protein PilR n=1 Tax=Candidatus Sulfuritelmatomonas gaucii TaxID=2043161 RepID=A0A2N9M2Z1_9BACT|nr:Type 4 fimbriae expression regulatory protein PilR [Candidatus Sulfotelmatomonas gaucii]